MLKDQELIGKLLMTNLRDISLETCDGLLHNRFESPGHKEIQELLKNFTPEQKQIFQKAVRYCIDGGINNFTYSLGKNIEDFDDNLNQKLYRQEGWIAKYSKYTIS